MLGPRHRRLRKILALFRDPMDLRHHGAVREWLPVAGNTGLVGRDHRGIAEDRRDSLVVLTGGNDLPAFVSPELGEREPTRHFHAVLVLLLGKCHAAHDGERQTERRAGYGFQKPERR